jgi:ABC-type transport system involved in multi-copper enzyme maturation permease subunit
MKLSVIPWKNPVLIKEVRTRMRGSRSFLLVAAYLIACMIFIGLAYAFFQISLSSSRSPDERRLVGKLLFGLTLWLQLVIVSFTAPALTSGAIASERERQTFDLLRVTLLKERALVAGKFLGGLVFILLLLFTSIPMQSPAFLVGGVTGAEIFISTVILMVSAIAFCAIGIFFSSIFSRTLVATVLSYAASIFLMFGIPMIAFIGLILIGSMSSSLPNQVPIALQAILWIIGWFAIAASPLAAIVGTEIFLIDKNNPWLAEIPLSNGNEMVLISPWILHVAIYLFASLLFLWASSIFVKRLEH